LLVERGPRQGEEIRFVRIPGLKQEITIGRVPGPAHRHVQLESATVSREHARLTFRDGLWTLRNESSTNPTILNGRALSSPVEEVQLHDGDRIVLGDVVLVFRQDSQADPLPYRSSWYTDRGRRSTNQDAVVIRTLPGGRELAAVCDGMGSHNEGGLASHVALEALVRALSEGSHLCEAVESANRAVLDAAGKSPDRNGMGTTLVAVLREGATYEIANVGDSRAYRIDADGIVQVTRDHSFIAEAIDAGRMSEVEAQQSPWKNAVTRSLGAEKSVKVDLFGRYDADRPALVMLCTDGVHGVLQAEDLLDIAKRTADVRDLARSLAEQALINGGEDNVAVAAVRFGGPGD
jgi:protein phosphatase